MTGSFKNNQIRWATGILVAVFFATIYSAAACQAYQRDRSGPDRFPPSMKVAAKAVRASTVTIRVDRTPTLKMVQGLQPSESKLSSEKNRSKKDRMVTVFSGVLIKQGFVVAPLFLPNTKSPEVRITLPDGEQTIGKPRILDEYSGLAIISIKDMTLPILKCCESSEPVVGDWVVSGAAWGRQQALISLGMVGGIGYRVPNSKIESPPMIVCDLRAAETSKGSGVVAANGKLIGVVMAVSSDHKWTYVVPSAHVHRLLRSLASHEKRADFSKDDILVLKRQAPHLGVRVDMTDWNKDSRSYKIMVRSVVPKGPAEQAGLKKGDQIKSVNGRVVRAWYDVVRDFFNRQPGDTIEMGIIRENRKLDLKVVLGGGFTANGENILKLKDYIRPEIDVDQESKKGSRQSPTQKRFSQLVNYSVYNLAPTPCFKTESEELLDSLNQERSKNGKLQARVDELESKLDRLLKLLDKQ